MGKIGIIKDIQFYLLLENINIKLSFFEFEKGDSFFYEIDNSDIEVLLIPENLDNLYFILSKLKEMGIILIVFGNNIDGKILRDLYNFGLINNYIEKEEYLSIEKVIENEKKKIKRKKNFFVKVDDGKEVLIEIDKIEYIIYDRNRRKSILYFGNEEYYIGKNLSELEKYFQLFNFLIRIDRGTIANINRIKFIDYYDESIIFNSGRKVYYTKKKLREIRENLKNRKVISCFDN
ncbi:LytTR family DNA-binding domain-containing protein [Haliovirga abyssi]|uniref:HTH LytTR-type domain-containing protein n=1 Tax=Haliovirga abyssi TaxID=2996794 RepID=A0AAU9DNL6_9FUSO|nr:LytTR family DNA-binding domain-containing protein [Haliovirga abyssi]BDU49948.1 hypothetical protein HLVA_05170 [Haliovirga abyssi]